MENKYDSAEDTRAHISTVKQYMGTFAGEIAIRCKEHDRSKLQDPEKATFDKVTPLLKELTYGSEKYKASLAEMGPALTHHYENNSHHPEHHTGGIEGMGMLDLIEMLCDWKAASERHADGNIRASLEHNRDRFDIPDALYHLLINTCVSMDRLTEGTAYGMRRVPKKRTEPGLAVEINATGHTMGDIDFALEEAMNKISEGYTTGMDSNDTGDYDFRVSGNEVEPEEEDEE